MPELLDTPRTLLVKWDYVAVLDIGRPGKHIETDCGVFDMPDDAIGVTAWVDRTEFPLTDAYVFKSRIFQVFDDREELLAAQTVRGTPSKAEKYWVTAHPKPATGRRIRLKAVVLTDAKIAFGIEFQGPIRD